MRKLKIALISLLIVTLFCVLASIGFFIGFGVTASKFMPSLGGLGEFFKVFFAGFIGGAFVYPFNPASEASQYFIYGVGQANAQIVSIMAYVEAALFFVLIILGIVLVSVKKKGAQSLFALVLLVVAAEVLALMTSVEFTFAPIKSMSEAGLPQEGKMVGIMALMWVVFLGLATILTLVTYILGLVNAGRRERAIEPAVIFDQETAPVLAEENIENEVVEEGAPEPTVYEEAPVEEVEPELVPDPVPEEPVEVEEEVQPVEEEPVEVAEEPVEVPEEPVVEPEPVVEEEPQPVEEPEVQPEPEEEPAKVEVNVNNAQPAPAIDQNALAALLREVVRDIVRDEIARNNANQPKDRLEEARGNAQNITGATFGGPLVVQYFNGGINGVTPCGPVQAQPAPQPQPAPAPVVEEKKEEPAPVAEEPAPVVEEAAPAPVVEEAPKEEEKPVYERISFAERLLQSDKELLDLYNELKNEILSYGVKSRISSNGDTFRLHKKMYVRITVAGKSLKLYFALNPADYADSKIPVQDVSHKGMYEEIPLMFKVRSGLSVRRAKELIQAVMEQDHLEQGEIGKVNWAKELKAELGKKEKEEK